MERVVEKREIVTALIKLVIHEKLFPKENCSGYNTVEDNVLIC